MRFITVRELRLKPGQIWDQLKEEDVVITSNGKPIAILTAVQEDDLLETLATLRRARALAALDRIHRRSVRQGTDRLTDEEIEAEIAAVRAERAR